MSVAMRRALVTLRGRCGREGGRTHRVSYGEHDGVEPPELGLILRGEIPECHVHGSPLLVVAVHLAATVVARASLAFLNGEACRVTPRPLARMSHHSVVARLCFGRLAAPGGGRAARRLAAHCAASLRPSRRRPGRQGHGSATAGATGSTHPGPSSAPAGDASRASAARYRRCDSRSPGARGRPRRGNLFSEYAASERPRSGRRFYRRGATGASGGSAAWRGFARYRAFPPQRATLVAGASSYCWGASHTAHHPRDPGSQPGIPGPGRSPGDDAAAHVPAPRPSPPEPAPLGGGNLADSYSPAGAQGEGQPGGKGVVTESRSWETPSRRTSDSARRLSRCPPTRSATRARARATRRFVFQPPCVRPRRRPG